MLSAQHARSLESNSLDCHSTTITETETPAAVAVVRDAGISVILPPNVHLLLPTLFCTSSLSVALRKQKHVFVN